MAYTTWTASWSRRVATALGALLFSALLAGGCGGNNTDADECDTGSEGCPCAADVCDSGLSCISNVCVYLPGSGGTAGSDGTGGSGGTTTTPKGGSGGTRSGGVPGTKPKPTGGTGGSAGSESVGGAPPVTECPPCEGATPVCDTGDFMCKTCTDAEGCSGDTPLCDAKANSGLGVCIAEPSGEGGAGGEGSVVVVVPAEWTCLPSYYGDGGCDCGCGAVDVDCADATRASCAFCLGCSASAGECPGRIHPTDNSSCVDPGWTCPPQFYGDAGCDCGCGIRDVDCADGSLEVCAYCLGCNLGGTCPGGIDPTDNSQCDGWVCNQTWYGDGACDCGCGEVDSDCADSLIASCEFCLGCSSGGCPGLIDPNNNATCGP